MKSKSLLPLFLLLILIGCQSGDTLFQKRISMKNNTWNRFDILKFDVSIEDTLNSYDIIAEIRHAAFYPYQNLLLNFSVNMPSSEERVQEHNIKIRSEQGTFLGDGLGDIYDLSYPLMTEFVFPQKGNYHFEMENLMTKFNTEGIMEVGLTITRSGKHTAKKHK